MSTRRWAEVKEREVEVALFAALLVENSGDDAVIARQREVCGGLGRVDVVVVNGSLSVYEIKSPADSLARLPRQVELYSRFFDFASLVTSHRYVAQANRLLPTWWGLRQCVVDDFGIRLETLREPGCNPDLQPDEVVKLLWRDELYAELASVRGMTRLSKAPLRELRTRLVSECHDLDELRRVVRQWLKVRPSWRAARPPS